MRVAIFSNHTYDQNSFEEANGSFKHELVFLKAILESTTASLASGFPAVCVFVNDRLDASVLAQLAKGGTKFVALRCAGCNNVGLEAAEANGITVVRVPAYSPHSVAEFTVGALLALDRQICRGWLRVRGDNFSLEGLLGRDLHGKSVGVIGTGRIGALVAKAFKLGFGCDVVAHDVYRNPELEKIGVHYVEFEDLLGKADVISLHCPLTPQTRHLINEKTLALAKPGMLLVNTSRGALVDTRALIEALKSGKAGGVAMDVYEQEPDLFFEDLSNEVVKDDVFQRLLTFPNVIVTGHQAFFTREALAAIAQTTLQNIADLEVGRSGPRAAGQGCHSDRTFPSGRHLSCQLSRSRNLLPNFFYISADSEEHE
jgi:D-lactate dehydrogenase